MSKAFTHTILKLNSEQRRIQNFAARLTVSVTINRQCIKITNKRNQRKKNSFPNLTGLFTKPIVINANINKLEDTPLYSKIIELMHTKKIG